ncbi:MAG TPA: hypothetical protein VFE78_16485 [Gemmataceae bacterium]|jgi:hypothetical protein|nr:hypothetical protein [Gemmataceae bacterium]
MKGLIRKGVALALAAMLGGAAVAAAGDGCQGCQGNQGCQGAQGCSGCAGCDGSRFGNCQAYRNLVDPCYPQRYEFMARREVNGAFIPQVQNGHVLDQTIWNYMFEVGTDRLTTGGLAHLAYMARRRPCPDTVVYLQTAQDVVYDAANPDKLVSTRQELDVKRGQAIERYLVAQTAGHVVPQIVVHDPAEVGQAAIPVGFSVQQMYFRSRGGLQGGGGGGNVQGGAGASGGGAGVGGAGGLGGGGAGAVTGNPTGGGGGSGR